MRAHYVKIIQTEIHQLERFREQAVKRSSADNITRFDQKIADLRNELDKEDTPRYLNFVAQQKEITRIQQKHQSDKKVQHQHEIDNKMKLDAFYKEENMIRRNDRQLQYQMKREWEWLCKTDARLPDYIRENLSNMPNNKGYIWKGIWYFGKKPAERKDMLIMFDKSGDSLIHEIKYNQYHKIFQKTKNGNVLLSEKRISTRR